MAKFTTTVSVDGLEVEKAFAYLADFSSTQEWDPGIVRGKRNDEGPIRTGSSFDVVSSFLGREIPLTYEIVELRENQLVVLRAENNSVISLDELKFSETESGCAVTYEAELTGKGSFRIMNPVLQLLFNRIGQAAEDGLVKHLKQLAADSSAAEGSGRGQ